MRIPRVLEAWNALVHVPAERPDHPNVVVVPHVAVGHDVETRFFLITDHRRDRVVVRFFVLHFLERDSNVAAEQLMLEPMWPGIGPDHGRRENGVDDLRCHSILCLLACRYQQFVALGWRRTGTGALLTGMCSGKRAILSYA